ncbi:hypothetical protein LB505_007339 [Fusarium chuoi]|nr:hypothetical protein LB505_007339 [Fusarium chuoi]
MRLVFILVALQGVVLAQKAQTHTKEFCETRMSRTPVSDTPRVTISTKVQLTASKPYCNRKHLHETFKVNLGPVTSTIVTRSIYTSSVTAPQKVKTLTITKTITNTAATTPTFIKTDTTVYTTTSTLTSTVTVPTVSGFVPLAFASSSASRKRSQSKRALPRKNAWEDITHVFPSRVVPRNAKPKSLKDPCTIRIESGDKNHPVHPTQSRGAVACYKSVQITKTVLFKSCIAWTKTITLDQKTVTKHDITRGWVTSTVTEADTTMTADDTATTTSILTKATTTETTTETETGTSPIPCFVASNYLLNTIAI